MRGTAIDTAGIGRAHPRRALERVIPPSLAREWADYAAESLFRTSPRASARAGIESRQLVLLLAPAVFLTLWAAVWPPLSSAILLAVSATVVTLAGMRLAAAVVTPRPETARPLPDDALPVVTVLAPLFREAGILSQLVAALKRIDYPGEKLDLKLIVEAIDTDTLAAARRLELDARFEIVVVPSGRPQTKPRALNYAMRFAAGSIVCVYDAEDVPHPRQIRTAAEVFAASGERLACLQAPLGWYNRDANWLTRQFALEYAGHFNAFLPLLERLGCPLPLGGTSNFIRRDALEGVGLWDPCNVTEDADLGFRLAAHGYRTGLIAPPTSEEAPETAPAWLHQRSRWIKGHAQTFAVHTRDPQRLAAASGPAGPFTLFATLGATVISALLHGPAVILCLLLIAAEPGDPLRWSALAFIAFGYVCAAACAAAGARRAGFTPRLADLATMPLYWPLQTIAAARALWELRSDPYFWAKTEHGHSPAPETETLPECPLPSPSLSWPVSRPVSASAPGSRAGRQTRRAARA